LSVSSAGHGNPAHHSAALSDALDDQENGSALVFYPVKCKQSLHKLNAKIIYIFQLYKIVYQ
jgi:hypothetical protein